jgi:hypothetical protein
MNLLRFFPRIARAGSNCIHRRHQALVSALLKA